MQTLEIRKITIIDEAKTIIDWARLDTEKEGWGDFGIWEVEGVKTEEEVVEYAKTMIDEGIEVILNLETPEVKALVEEASTEEESE